MHGRVKVKTSAQEQEEKRKERERKLKIYRAGFETVIKKRKNGEYDEEVNHITEQLLCGNPDIYTFWNVRRESLKLQCETKSPAEYEKVLEGELKVTEAALRSNPKSYGAWYHRMWALQAMKIPPLTCDFILCTKLLKADPRNFHCWDYRRWLSLTLSAANKDEVELEFSFEKLAENFSNYSAWHYRTHFLPRVHMDKNAPCSITAKQHQKELELVQNAVFTDPGDQSAWFYLRWLLGKSNACKPQLRQGVLQCNTGCIVSASLTLTVAEKIGESKEQCGLCAELRIGKRVVQGHWECSGSLKHSHIWKFIPDTGDEEEVFSLEKIAEVEGKEFGRPLISLVKGGEDVDVLFLERACGREQNGLDEWVGIKEVDLDWGGAGGNLGRGLVTSLLEEQLELCSQLLELEPESRWTLLTSVQLMRALRKRHSEPKVSLYHQKIMEYLDRLRTVDPLRSGFYSDMRSECILDAALSSNSVKSSVVDLSSLGLTTLPSPTVPLPLPLLMAVKIDLSKNPLLMLPSLRSGALICLAHLPRLRHLRLGADFQKLGYTSSLQGALPKLPQLLHLELVPSDADTLTSIPSVIVGILRELMPALQSLKPV